MPRGKYDRKVSKINRLEAELKQTMNERGKLKDELEKTKAMLAAARKSTPHPKQEKSETLGSALEEALTLRSNLSTISAVRKQLVDSDQIDNDLLHSIDEEIKAHVRLVGNMRRDIFHDEEEQQTESKAPAYPIRSFTPATPYGTPQAPPYNPQH